MSANFINAAPMTEMLGIHDLSVPPAIVVAETLPQHLPFVYLYTQKGPEAPQLVVGNARDQMYGADSFDMRKQYATHATELSNIVNKAANSHFIKRLKPDDAATSTHRIYADVLATTLTDYVRNSDGSIKKDAITNLPVPVVGPKIAGYSVKFVLAEIGETVGEVTTPGFGMATQMPGDQTDPITATQSIRYPLFDVENSSFGGHGDLEGLRMWAANDQSSTPIDNRLVVDQKVYPFRIACIKRASALASPSIVATTSAEQYLDVVLKPNFIDVNTDQQMYVGDRFIQSYQNLNTPGMPPQYGLFGRFHAYDASIAALLAMFTAAELPFAATDPFTDLVVGDTDQDYRFNFMGGVTSSGTPYHSYVIKLTADDEFRFGETSNLYGQGGADGTMNETLFAQLVSADVVNFADPNSIYQNDAIYPISDFYDTGFPLQTKYDLISFIAQRKDTTLALTPYDALGLPLTLSQESSLAVALLARMRNYPESDYFGTPTVRGVIMGRSGTLIGSAYRKNLPLTLELANKKAAYMGAGNGKWTNGKNFDFDPGNKITLFKDINVTNVPAGVRNKDWDAGLNWVENFDRQQLYFPALQTIFPDDRSVLKSVIVMQACCTVERVGQMARRQFSGVSTLTNAQLIDRVNKFVLDNTEGKFDGKIIVIPECYFTETDLNNGFSWTLKIKIYGPTMKTIQTLFLESYRIDDLPALPA